MLRQRRSAERGAERCDEAINARDGRVEVRHVRSARDAHAVDLLLVQTRDAERMRALAGHKTVVLLTIVHVPLRGVHPAPGRRGGRARLGGVPTCHGHVGDLGGLRVVLRAQVGGLALLLEDDINVARQLGRDLSALARTADEVLVLVVAQIEGEGDIRRGPALNLGHGPLLEDLVRLVVEHHHRLTRDAEADPAELGRRVLLGLNAFLYPPVGNTPCR
mmetsp:Transcript_35961/g.101214  ORF Transcript_35961/g.101214 Transcript_35961/m.101214 type:complete len:219 (-) Transcript_35961:878-1534(-)